MDWGTLYTCITFMVIFTCALAATWILSRHELQIRQLNKQHELNLKNQEHQHQLNLDLHQLTLEQDKVNYELIAREQRARCAALELGNTISEGRIQS
jgi:hypothetical protein